MLRILYLMSFFIHPMRTMFISTSCKMLQVNYHHLSFMYGKLNIISLIYQKAIFGPYISVSNPISFGLHGKEEYHGPRTWSSATYMEDVHGVYCPDVSLSQYWLMLVCKSKPAEWRVSLFLSVCLIFQINQSIIMQVNT